jgi:hypothetical protein
MNTAREAMLNALQSLCAPLVLGGVYRSREAALARAEGPAIVIRPDNEAVEFKAGVLAMRDLTVTMEVIARGQVPDQIADPIVAAMHAKVMADPTLGGRVARTIEDGTKWEFEEADMNAVSVQVRYKLRYLTAANSLAAQI